MKNKRLFRLLPILLISTLIIIQVACGDQSNKIIGKWLFDKILYKGKIVEYDTNRRKGTVLEFFKDKSFVIFLKECEYSGTWVDLEDGRVKMTYSMPPSEVHIATLQGDTLKIKFICSIPDSGFHNTEAILVNSSKKQQPEEAKYETDIIGTWQTVMGKLRIERTFNKNKKMDTRVYVSGEEHKPPVQGTLQYKFIDKNRIETTEPKIYKIKKLTSDELILFSEDWGKDIIYKKISQ